jgi:beta-lactamase class D
MRTLLLFVITVFCAQYSALAPAAASASARDTAPCIDQALTAYGHEALWIQKSPGQTATVAGAIHRRATALPPASTFKVLLALIGLETGALKSADEVIAWDKKSYMNRPEWQRDMALREAMASSSEPYFKTLARRIGHAKLRRWLSKLNYGNQQLGPAVDMVWMDGGLLISAEQQLEFFDRLRQNQLPIRSHHIDAVKATLLAFEQDGVKVYGKTGSLPNASGKGVGWWAGWVESTKAKPRTFVLQLKLKEMDNRQERIALSFRLLGVGIGRDSLASNKPCTETE